MRNGRFARRPSRTKRANPRSCGGRLSCSEQIPMARVGMITRSAKLSAAARGRWKRCGRRLFWKVSRRLWSQETSHTSNAQTPGRNRRSQTDRHALGQAAGRVWTLDSATVGGSTRGTGSCRRHQSRNCPANAKKNGMTKRKIEYWVIPPEADAEFVAGMEEVLETYEKPYAPNCPVLCMDEQPVQLLKETRTAIPATSAHGRRVDYDSERAGTANL